MTLGDLRKHNPIKEFAERHKLHELDIIEIHRLCDMDVRFSITPGTIRANEIEKYLKRHWKLNMSARKIRYMYNVLSRYTKYEEVLIRGGKVDGTYVELILNGS